MYQVSHGAVLRPGGEFTSKLLGHADPGFTLRTYAHLMPNADDRARKSMDAFYGTAQQSALNVPARVTRDA